jgi:glycosyltransferase involved in cell wall biosynthesis
MFYILIDDLFGFAARYRSLTGIQRVIVEVIKQLCMAFGHDKVRILSWSMHSGFHFYSSTLFTPDYVYDQKLFCDYFDIKSGPRDISLDNYIKSRYSGQINSGFHKFRYRVKNIFDGGKTFKKRRIIDRNFSIEDPNKFDPHASDENITIYAPGAFWMPQLELLYSLRSRSAGKIKIIGQLYDLTPLKTPEFHDPPLVEIFGKSLENFIASADGIISISNNTLKDLRSYADAKNLSLPPCPVVQLAHEFPLVPNQNAQLSNAVRYVQRFPFVLSVGLLDGRKNNWSLARVWQQLDRDIGLNTPLLVFAGSLDRSSASLEKIGRAHV